jgi:ribonuclease HI
MKESAATPLQGSPERGVQKVTLYVDGSSKGNPGEGGAGVIIRNELEGIVLQSKRYLGIVTNNVAEYQALILGLHEAKELGAQDVEICLDSELVVNQINGVYRVRDSKLKPLEGEVKRLLKHFARWVIRHIPREENREADRLAREAVRDKEDQVVADPDT